MAKKKSFSINKNLAQALGDTANAAKNYSSELHVEIIPICRIELDPENPRELMVTLNDITNGLSKTDPLFKKKSEEIKSLESLSKTIKEQGIINPATVYKHSENYRLIAGERRVLASLLAGKKDIQAKILPQKPLPLKLTLLQWIENNERVDLSLWERINNLQKILFAFCDEQKKPVERISGSDITQLIGCSPQLAANYKLVMNTSQVLQEAIKENQVKNLDKAALIAKSPDKMHAELIEACKNGATIKSLKTLAASKKADNATIEKPSDERNTSHINLGSTPSLKAARLIMDSVLQQKDFLSFIKEFENVIWDDYKSVNIAFKKLLKIIEQSA
jgi:ParB family transcriptional regulator, chromosome partitioning protein